MALIVILGGWSTAFANVDINIRADGALTGGQNKANFVSAISDCSEIAGITVSAGETQLTIYPAATRPLAGSPDGCELSFDATGEEIEENHWRFSPQIQLAFKDTSIQTYEEFFHFETTPAELSFEGIQLTPIAGKQHLVVAVNARDDVDIQ
jgi:hypothetical protein